MQRYLQSMQKYLQSIQKYLQSMQNYLKCAKVSANKKCLQIYHTLQTCAVISIINIKYYLEMVELMATHHNSDIHKCNGKEIKISRDCKIVCSLVTIIMYSSTSKHRKRQLLLVSRNIQILYIIHSHEQLW